MMMRMIFKEGAQLSGFQWDPQKLTMIINYVIK